ncbi:hypothetical protein Y032_0064g3502 [Ancylostoma ceylanicum]|uniref:Uncharacterized protein n=1 Tax=Ancylostoma ceylanicum TaxID=53326 RepID=A0A016U1J3_9BILA|nr:hypothetical protein Y032_0064g3502 [Ancylostoma ceylanicum]
MRKCPHSTKKEDFVFESFEDEYLRQSTCALFIGSYRLRSVNVRLMDDFEGRRCILLQSDDDGIVESLVIPFLHILRINSHRSKDSETHSHGISVELDTTASKKLALIYAEALNDEQRKIIFYDLTRFDEPKMTITMLFTSAFSECSCFKRLDTWVRQGNLECVSRDAPNGLVVLEELPFTRWSTYLLGIGVITKWNSRGFSSVYDIADDRRKNSEGYAVTPTESTVTRELPNTRKSRSNHLYKDVFDSDGTHSKDISAVDKVIIESDIKTDANVQQVSLESA